jgi:hypothetical protein
LNPVTAHTTSKISDFAALDLDRYFTACAFVIALRVAIDSSIGPGEPETPKHQRRHAQPGGPF